MSPLHEMSKRNKVKVDREKQITGSMKQIMDLVVQKET
jgi:hypothetical protein